MAAGLCVQCSPRHRAGTASPPGKGDGSLGNGGENKGKERKEQGIRQRRDRKGEDRVMGRNIQSINLFAKYDKEQV